MPTIRLCCLCFVVALASTGSAAELEDSRVHSPQRDPLSQASTISWSTANVAVSYSGAVELNESGGISFQLEVENRGSGPILVLTERKWVLSIQERTAYLSLGTRDLWYGNELPVLTTVPANGNISIDGSTDLPNGAIKNIDRVELVFLGVFEGAETVLGKVSNLEIVAGWYQTGDLDLADCFLSFLIDRRISFPLVPQRPD